MATQFNKPSKPNFRTLISRTPTKEVQDCLTNIHDTLETNSVLLEQLRTSATTTTTSTEDDSVYLGTTRVTY